MTKLVHAKVDKVNGFIYVVGPDKEHLAGECLAPAEAIELAIELTQAVEDSIWRDQIGTPYYTDSKNILRRQDAPLGQAIKALRKVFG